MEEGKEEEKHKGMEEPGGELQPEGPRNVL